MVLFDSRQGALPCQRVGHIQQDRLAHTTGYMHQLCRLLCGGQIPVRSYDFCTAPGERKGGRTPDAATRTGNENNLVTQVHFSARYIPRP